MIPYKLDHSIENILRTGPSMERTLLKVYTGNNFSDQDARRVWQRIDDHKWYLSERLGRDVGFHVAAVDFVENFYSPSEFRGGPSTFEEIWKRGRDSAIKLFNGYFEEKSKAMTM